ncbi:hypothetical protein Mam01_26290 [Microbispora amethystogenes]|uniref:HNH nuclease domain-containing protein n=1 Tax=Microbispora amethystogenes TaxID=1427754 RepID=A0ABQ4FCA7_9ACTN|nr:hypothetical protein Mam01_26290 [Microbispora amethystogenes]
MDLFDADPECLTRSNDTGTDGWWEQLIARSPLWSAEDSLARAYVPIVDPATRKCASRFNDSAESTESPDSARPSNTRRGNVPGAEYSGNGTASRVSPDGVSPGGIRRAGSGGPADAFGTASDGASGSASDTARDAAGQNRDEGPEGDTGGASCGVPGGAAGAASAGAFGGASGGASPGACGAGSSSWVAVAAVAEAARVVALVPVPEAAEMCLAEAGELLSARDRITSALAARVGRVHRAGEAKGHGHASTKLWLRSAGGMTPAGAGRLLTMSMELHRLHEVRRLFAEGGLPEGVVEAICTATAGLTDDQAATAEGILLELARSAGAAEVAKAGRYLRAVLDPDGHEKDEQADFDRRFLRVRRRRSGGVEGEFYLPVEAAARLQQLLDVYAKPKAEGDDRTLSVRNADALIAFLENKIATELLVLVNAESLPDDPTADPATDSPGTEPAGTDPTDDPTTDSPGTEPASTEPAGTDPTDDLADDPAGTDPSTDQPADPDDERPGPEHSAAAPGGEPRADDVPGRDRVRCESDISQCDSDRSESDAPMRSDEQWAEAPVGQDPVKDAPTRGGERSAQGCSATGGLDPAGPRSHSADPADSADPVGTVDPADRGGVGEVSDTWQGRADETDTRRHRARDSRRTCAQQAPAPDPSPERDDAPGPHTEDRPSEGGPSGDCPGDRRAHSCPNGDRPSECRAPGLPGEDRCGGGCPDCEAVDYRHSSAPGAAPRGRPGVGADAPPGAEHGGGAWPGEPWPGGDTWSEAGADAPPGSEYGGGAWLGGDARLGCGSAWLGGEAWTGVGADAPPGAERGGGAWPGAHARPGVGVNGPPGVWLRGLPGLILATGHLLPVSSVHRLARTSTLVRIVMDAAGQVLDMGRKVRLATPAQRRAVFARYATCWVDGCPLPATLCQIDHADDWSRGGLTDLKLLGPACQFHNRDRYRHPTRYTRRKIGDDRWAFTYRNPRTTRLRV